MNRIKKLISHIPEGETWMISNPVDLFYLTGLELSLGRLFVSKKGYTLGVDGRYFVYAQEALPGHVTLCEKGNWTKLLQSASGTLVFDSLYETYASYETFQKAIGRKGLIAPQRMIKERDELEKMRKAAFALEEGYSFVLSRIRKGVTEKELATKLLAFWLDTLGLEKSFDPIIAFGKHSALPHAKPRDVALQEGDLVLIDIGVAFEHYKSDMTRMVMFGKPTDAQTNLLHLVYEAHSQAVHQAHAGIKVASLDQSVRNYFASNGFSKEFCHSLGHGIGLDVHESPLLRTTSEDTLEEGMVITIEPGLYCEDIGGVRLENSYLVTKDRLESFMVSDFRPLVISVL